MPAIPGLPGALPLPALPVLQNNFFNLPPPLNAGPGLLPSSVAAATRSPPPKGPTAGPVPVHYPSQDPSRMGATQPPQH